MARRGKFGKAALLMGAAAVAAGVLLKRDKVAGLLSPGSRDAPEPSWTPAPPPAPANYDAPGPVANTATPVPAPEPFTREEDGSIDERAEEAAAAAEAANIGGQVSDYAAVEEPALAADEADRPLVEAGEGSSEGQEQAEAALADAASQPAEGANDYQRQIEDTIEDAGRPFSGERLEPVAGADEPAGDAEERGAEAAAADIAAAPERATPPPPPPPPTLAETQPQGQIPFGDGAAESQPPLAETPAVPATEPEAPAEAAAPPEEEQITPAAPQTAGWQPPEPADADPEPPAQAQQPAVDEPASSDPTPPTEEQTPPEKDDEDGGGDDWRTWSGRAINP